MRISNNFLSAFLCAIAYCFFVSAAQATDLREVIVTGQARVTSSMSMDVYRNRALENAFEKLIANNPSFIETMTISENGKLVFDQIHKSSRIEIINVVQKNEKITNGVITKQLAISFIDKSNSNQSNNCRFPKVDAFKTNLKIIKASDPASIPFWFELNADQLLERLTQENSLPIAKADSRRNNSQTNVSVLYSLPTETLPHSENNQYGLNIQVKLTHQKAQTFLTKQHSVLVHVQYVTRRSGQVISTSEIDQRFDISKRHLNGLINTSKNQLSSEMSEIYKLLLAGLDRHLTQHNCVQLHPNLTYQNEKVIMDLGESDGVKTNDIVIASLPNGAKNYFGIGRMSADQTELKPISEVIQYEQLKFAQITVSGSQNAER